MKRNRTYRIRTDVGGDMKAVHFNIDNSIKSYELLSLNITQKNAYRLMSSDRGVVAGRVLANGGFGIPNARVSIFIAYDGTDSLEQQILYHYASPRSSDDNGVRYNLLPESVDDVCHQNVGTFPNKRYMLDNDSWVDVFDKYYALTTRTNASGDYMIYGVPVGMQELHMDLDLSDIGPLSQRPRDMMSEGYDPNMFESPNKFKSSTNLNSLSQIKSEDTTLYVYPFWGDTTDTNTNACITRHDINVNYTFKPTCVFMGSVVSDTGENSMSKKCVGSKKQGKMSEMMTGEGKIEMIRKTFDGNTEEFSVKGNQLINGDGVWCYQIPMNLDYVVTDEFGNTVLSDNPDKGIPTRARVRFRISMSESPNDMTARKRARYLIPNNPHLIESDYPYFSKNKEVDYEFGTKTKDENFRDLMWNNVYTVKSYIPRIQKSNLPNTLRHIGIKAVNHPGANNPMPFNNLRIKMNFTYMFMCALVKVFVYLTLGVNRVITLINYALFKIAQGFIGITYWLNGKALGSFWGKRGSSCGNEGYHIGKKYGLCRQNLYNTKLKKGNNENHGGDEDEYDDGDNGSSTNTPVYNATLFMLAIIHQINTQRCDSHNANLKDLPYIIKQIGSQNPCTTVGGKKIGVKGFAAVILAIVYLIGCGIELRGLCETEEGEEINVTPGTLPKLREVFQDVAETYPGWFNNTCNDNVAKLFNCIENELAQDNEVTSFNFYNDWINGVLYFPLWYRKIKPKRKFLGLFEIKAKDQWCSVDSMWIRAQADNRQIKVYNTCSIERSIQASSGGQMGESLNPLEDDYPTVDVARSRADDETGIEKMEFNTYEEKNCYGYKCHRYTRTAIPMRSGLMKEKETMLGDLVYYYKPCEYNTRYTKDLVTLFATDIVLLGSLSDCDIHGVPQFFKALESTTYNMPPDLMSEAYEYNDNTSSVYDEENNESFINNSTRRTEYTGADWGDLGYDQSNYSSTNGGNTTWDANENIYDNGGLFYGITCFNSFTKPKSCINLSRICEFGVSLDESQDILSTSSVSASPDNLDDSMYSTLTPDGFVGYDEVYNPDYRSMFATLNANFLRTKLNYRTGLYEYDFNHLYLDNFDGSLYKLMQAQSVRGNTQLTNHQANYVGNYNLERSSDAYLNFRYGNYEKSNGKRLYFYDYNKNIAKVGPIDKPGERKVINAQNRLPRYENSLYFYFGLKEGKTAIDSFYTQYYSDCRNDEVLQKNYEITGYANSVCPIDSNDWCVAFSINDDPDFSVTFVNAENDLDVYYTEAIHTQQFYLGTIPNNVSLPGYSKIKLYVEATGEEMENLSNGVYLVTITTGSGDTIKDTLRLMPSAIENNVEPYDFSCKNIELDSLFASFTQSGEYDWSVMFPAIANYKTDANQGAIINNRVNRLIGGYIKVGDVGIDSFSITVEPASASFFMDGTGNMLYTAPKIIVVDNSTVYSQSGDGFLGNDGTDFYFGVPYGSQKYIVTITQYCYDSSRESVPYETTNFVSETVDVNEGDFKMYINGVDYDNIQAFKTGWTEIRLYTTNPSPTFDYSDIYGWDDLDNIGNIPDTGTLAPRKLQSLGLDWLSPISDIVYAGDAVCDDYDGNGATFTVDGVDCSTPYTWTKEFCLDSEIWGAEKAALQSGITAVYTNPDTGDSEQVDSIRMIASTNYVEYRAMVGSVLDALVATEYFNDNEIAYEEGFSDLQGPTLRKISVITDDINEVIEKRLEFVRVVKGAFRIGYDETELSLSYRTVSTPVKYLIAGMSEHLSAGRVRTVTDMESDNQKVVIGTRTVFDLNLEQNSVSFIYPTLTYDITSSHYEPYSGPATIGTMPVEKIPYYVAIQNNTGMALPTASSSSGLSTASIYTRVTENFSDTVKTNPYLNSMFGVHFFDNPMYYRQKRVVSAFNNMLKYETSDFVSCDALAIGFAVNGISSVSVTLDSLPLKSSSLYSGDAFRNPVNDRLIYDDSTVYGTYSYDNLYKDEYNQPIEYQYFTSQRNRTLTIDDGYGTPYTTTLVCDCEFNTSGIILKAVSNTSPEPKISVPLLFNGDMPSDTVYHVFWYNGTNHPLDYSVYDQSYNRWKFQDSSHSDCLNEMFRPGYDFTHHPGYIRTVSTPLYEQESMDVDQNKNHLFFVAESDLNSTIVFSPVIECAGVNVVRRFHVDSSQDQDAYTLYFIRRYQNTDVDRNHCDITDFYYLTHFPFTISFKTSDDGGVTFQTMCSYVVDPNDCWQGRIQLDDEMNVDNNENYTQTFGEAIKVSLAYFSDDFGEQIPSWWSIWVTDVIGVERACPGVSGDNTYVTEL